MGVEVGEDVEGGVAVGVEVDVAVDVEVGAAPNADVGVAGRLVDVSPSSSSVSPSSFPSDAAAEDAPLSAWSASSNSPFGSVSGVGFDAPSPNAPPKQPANTTSRASATGTRRRVTGGRPR